MLKLVASILSLKRGKCTNGIIVLNLHIAHSQVLLCSLLYLELLLTSDHYALGYLSKAYLFVPDKLHIGVYIAVSHC